MGKMSRNEHFIRNILALLQQMLEHDLEKDMKKYIDELEFGSVEQNSLYAKCVYELKHVDYLTGEEYKEALESICNHYLSYEIGSFNPIKKQTNRRKEKTKQLNLDISKEKMEKFDRYLKKNKQTKKSIIEKAIDDYINENEKNS